MQKQIIKYLLITLILSLGFGQLLRFDLFGLPLYLHDVLVVLLLVLNFRARLVTRLFRTRIGIKLILLGLGLGWLNAILRYPITQLLVPFLYTLRLLSYLALYFTLKHSKIKIPKSIFLISVTVSLCIGIAQYIFMPDMRVFQYLGWDDHLYRLVLPHFDPTFTAVMLGLGLLTIVPAASIFYILCSLFFTMGILLTYSRSVWLSLALTAGYFVKPKKLLLFLVPISLVAIFLLPRRFGEGTNLLRTFSIDSRATNDLAIVRDLNWNLATGVGMNTFALNSTSLKGFPNHATGPNNSYLYILATTGVIGLIGWGILLKNFYLNSRFKPLILFILLASLFNNVLFYPFVMLWFFLLESLDIVS